MGIKKRLKRGAAKRGLKALKNRLRKQRGRLMEWADRSDRQLQAVREVKNRLDDMQEMGAMGVEDDIKEYRETLEELQEVADPDGGLKKKEAETFKRTLHDIYDRAEKSVDLDG